ncbi:MAG: hypothetical protein RI553_13120 [Salibaculum sp.]|uniref:hypothetical protein n=1 Tax=Salibaculum sp. TaxID=2855480 RepID=UPI0028705F6B|nr:hypothetical protein [Salibaculum sp.]MDR9429032.1 hypothetical protein [Salibaculum sp.]
MDDLDNKFEKVADRSVGQRMLGLRSTSAKNILSMGMRQALLSLNPYESLKFPDIPAHMLNLQEGEGAYLRRIQQAVLMFSRGRPQLKLATRRSKDQETGLGELWVIRKPEED